MIELANKPEVVTLCGSARFKHYFEEAASILTYRGLILKFLA